MENEGKKMTPYPNPGQKNNIIAGLILVIIGIAILIRNMSFGVWFPHWIFTWPMLLVVMGLISGGRHNFRGAAWIILTALGVYFLMVENRFLPFDLRPFTLPIVLIAIGLFIILKRRHPTCDIRRREWQYRHRGWTGEHTNWPSTGNDLLGFQQTQGSTGEVPNGDYLDVNSLLGSNNRRIISKQFKGGRVSCIFGGAEIDLTQCDIEDTVVIDIVAAFGGVDLSLPANWNVRNEISVFLGGVDDKRRSYSQPGGATKTVILKGTVMFGGVEIKSY